MSGLIQAGAVTEAKMEPEKFPAAGF